MSASLAVSAVVVPAAPPAPVDSEVHAARTAERRSKSHTEPAREMPVVKGLPVVGNILEVRKKGMIRFLEDAWRTHGDVFRVDMGMPGIIVAHPDGLERILASHRDNFIKGKTYDGARRVLGDGLLTLEGQEWRARRRMIQPGFHRGALGDMATTMVETGRAFFDGLKARMPSGGVVDMHREMVTVTLDVVVKALFGDGLEKAAKVSYESLGAALELVSELANGVPLPPWVPTPLNRKFKRVMPELEAAVYAVIAHGRARKEPDSTLLSMLLATKDADTGELLTDTDVRNEVFTLFVAGHETTALTLTWLFTLLDGQGAVVEKMREEVTRVLGGRDPGYADVPKLPYLRQIVDETLRLRGPVALNARTARNDDNIMGFKIRAGETVMPFFWGAHRHPDFWKNPNAFDPERFTVENSKDRDPWSYTPFSAGQRVCIGNTFSLVESVLLIAMMVQRFEWKLVPGQAIEPNVIATVRPSGPVNVELKWKS
jgi:cytochrome P450